MMAGKVRKKKQSMTAGKVWKKRQSMTAGKVRKKRQSMMAIVIIKHFFSDKDKAVYWACAGYRQILRTHYTCWVRPCTQSCIH